MILYAEIECMLYEGDSLKQKRSVLKQIINKLRRTFNISVSELDYHDVWQRTKLGIAIVTTDYIHAERVIHQVLDVLDANPELERTITNIERL